ncbi:isopeptide-forming domain-containing fimbrial protein [Staphylococcus epidermidis]|nr:isopeptide-forming domain-containing fimbrial protein [Staphylococcus epidermidis]MCG1591656.1 isopeptide-forming domain-containing fimbrial protein [Staphylococcus epidermidis]MCG2478647.1 isopeptide-forming domain-containing fimbrial protein [Staphylococcus epidermidis]
MLDAKEVKAKPIKELTNVEVEVPNINSVASNKYEVIAGFNKEKTKVKPFGNVKWENFLDQDNDPVFNVSNPPNKEKGKFGVIYTNVAYYHGKPLDLKITVMDWNKYNNPDKRANITYPRYVIGHVQSGFNWIDQIWEYVDHETGNPVKITGSYMTFSDFDGKQYVQFDKETTKRIDKLYVSNDTWVDGEVKNGKLKISDISGKRSTPEDQFARVTALFSGGKMRFKWGKDYTGFNRNIERKSGDQYFSFDAKKPVKTELLKPTKLVNDEDENLVKNNEIKAGNELLQYDISHNIPSEYPAFYYKSYGIKDNLSDQLKLINEPQIIDETDKNVTSMFENKSKGNQLIYQAKSNTLKSSDFYGHTYHLKFKASLKDSINYDNNLSEDGYFYISNIGFVQKEEKELKTNEVITKFKPINSSIHKTIIDNNREVEEKKVRVDETYKYRIRGVVGNSETIRNFAIVDDGEDVLSFDNVHVYDKNNQDITNQGTLTIDRDKNIVKWVPHDVSDIYGKSYTMEIESKIKPNADLKAYKHNDRYIIPNEGDFEINDKKVKSNSVNVYTIPIANSIHKTIIDNNREVEEKKVRVDEAYKYRIRGVVGNSETIRNFAIVDDGEDVLSFDNVHVYDKNNQDITNQGTLTIDRDKNIVKWVPHDVSDIYGKSYTMEIESKIKRGVKLDKYKNKKRFIIPNKSFFEINGKKIESNTVNVYTVKIPIPNPLNLNQIQQTLGNSKKLFNSNNEMLNSYNDITFNIKLIKKVIDEVKESSKDNRTFGRGEISREEHQVLDSSKMPTDELQQNEPNNRKHKNPKLNEIHSILPKTGQEDYMFIGVIGGLIIVLSLIHGLELLRRKE